MSHCIFYQHDHGGNGDWDGDSLYYRVTL